MTTTTELPKRTELTWNGEDALTVRGHGHSQDVLNAVLTAEYGVNFETRTATEYWIVRVPDRSDEFDMRWHVTDKSNRRAQAWTILE
jgi:hypothetical protein